MAVFDYNGIMYDDNKQTDMSHNIMVDTYNGLLDWLRPIRFVTAKELVQVINCSLRPPMKMGRFLAPKKVIILSISCQN